MSAHKANMQAVLVSQPAINQNQVVEELAMFGANGAPIGLAPFVSVTTDTAAATAAKTTTSVEPSANTLVFIKFTAGNTVVPTIQFSGGVVRTVWLGGAAPTAAKHTVAANGVVGYWFDGTILHQLGSM